MLPQALSDYINTGFQDLFFFKNKFVPSENRCNPGTELAVYAANKLIPGRAAPFLHLIELNFALRGRSNIFMVILGCNPWKPPDWQKPGDTQQKNEAAFPAQRFIKCLEIQLGPHHSGAQTVSGCHSLALGFLRFKT